MANIAIPNTFTPNTLIRSTDVNADFSEIQTKYNAGAVQTDVAKTITAVHTFANGAILGTGGTTLLKEVVYTQTITPASIAANTTAPQTFTVTGLTTADTILAFNPPSMTAGTFIAAVWVSALNTLSVQYGNCTAGALTPAAGTCRIVALRS